MKILIAHYRYFISGGPEKYMFNIMANLEQNGHKVIPFSIKGDKNQPTPFSKYFVEPIGGSDKVYFKDYQKNLRTITQLMGRSFYSFETKKAIKHQIKCESPDIVYILCFINKISPSIIQGAKEMNRKVIIRLSDYSLLCPRQDFLYQNVVCETCLNKGLFNAIQRKCVQNSLPASMIRVCSMKFHRFIKIYDQVDAFICPSKFLANKLIDAGFAAEKVFHIPTFIHHTRITPKYKGDYVLYYGRISEEKGIGNLIKGFQSIQDIPLKIVGDDTGSLAKELKQYVLDNRLNNIEFLGFKSGVELDKIVNDCKFIVVPAIWYDNMPNVILEAFANGKPVIASNIGSLSELVDDEVNGLLFKPGDINDLATKIKKLYHNDELVYQYGLKAREKVESQYNPDLHYYKLINVFAGNQSYVKINQGGIA
jgi:glycosyltransferase involved in cell wall biosynthesis